MATDRSVADVLQDILHNVQDILRSEVRLAKAEIRQEATQAATAALWMTIGVVGLLSAWMFLLWTAVYALATVLPLWAATLVIAVAVACAGGMVLTAGLRRFTRMKPMPERTIESLQENLEWMKQPTK
ncbi:MAG TPA: phage holin family protein [Vicinamibacterales bacterium]|nr:phage holin family protein [Vicinamibacterales bacterium]